MQTIEEFIDQLARTPAPPDSVNQYAYGTDENNGYRRANLRRYLEQMTALKPTVMLIAEAPGYRGMRITGVPFSSRALLKEGIPGQPLFGEGYHVPEDGDPKAWREATATIVWSVLQDVHPPSVHWNSYPFHPHLPGQPQTNRKPRKPEVDLGRPFLEAIIAIFQPEMLIAVGNTAHEALASVGIQAEKVRHPAQSGRNDFVAGMTRLLGK
ncbi:MAG: uracil-DNA glycosylase [Anaerolineae bacterium]